MAADPRLVVFDWDGTLVDSLATIVDAFSQAFSAAGVPAPPAAAVRRVVGLTLAEAVETLAPGQPAETLERLAAAYRQAYTALLVREGAPERLFDGVEEVLTLLVREGWVLGIATGKSQRGLAAALTRHGLNGRFATLQTADQGPGKPHPAMLERAMGEVGVAPEATVMVGDTVFDMAMARAAGATAVGVTWGYHPAEDLRGAGAVAVLETMDELPALLRSIL
ncbi:MAG: HAD-IA family hydrolase [Acidobacteriota bacterium]|jgi:phosphoglycolate phosphatase